MGLSDLSYSSIHVSNSICKLCNKPVLRIIISFEKFYLGYALCILFQAIQLSSIPYSWAEIFQQLTLLALFFRINAKLCLLKAINNMASNCWQQYSFIALLQANLNPCSATALYDVTLCSGIVSFEFTYILYGYFTDTGVIMILTHFQLSKL